MNAKLLLLLVGGTASTIAGVIYFTPAPAVEFKADPVAGRVAGSSNASLTSSADSPVRVNTLEATVARPVASASPESPARPFSPPRISSSNPAARSPGSSTFRPPAAPSSRATTQVVTPATNAPATLEDRVLVPLGASLPASLLDPGEGATQAQINVLDRMANDFVRQVQAPESEASAAPASTPNTARPADQQPTNWSAAAQAADERYRQLFGVEAYNAWSAAASKEGIQEKKNAAGR